MRSCYAEEKPGVESCRCSWNALGWASACGAAGASGPVLGGDRSRCVKREGCGRGGCVAEHWCPVVSQGWRDAASRSSRRCRGVICRSPSGRRSRSCSRVVVGCERSRVGSVVRRRRSPESCNAMPRSDVAASEYRASTAQRHAERRAQRPKPAKLAVNAQLRAYVQDRLSGDGAAA